MKRPLLVLASLAMALTPAVPARAALVADTGENPTVLNCLGLLFTNSEEHAAKCGGPFEMDTGTDPLVKGTFNQTCKFGSADLPIYGDAMVVWRLDVATSCCGNTVSFGPAQPETPVQWILPVGERVLVAC
jgi:hypothetical protein